MRPDSRFRRALVTKTLAVAAGVVALSSVVPGVAADAAVGGSSPFSWTCPNASIDGYQQWIASGEGTTIPANGTMLVRRGRGYEAKITFVNAEWHVAVVWLGNQFEAQANLSTSGGFWLTYSATDDLYVQLRPASHWSGGDKWLTKIPSTGGAVEQHYFSFAPDQWTWLPELGQPSYTFPSALAEARGLVFVGKTPNTLDFRQLQIDGYRPPCK
ncbi:hypothetical protein [Actinokineospora inagensis]|uniref:hypothetical protein n=1 Tax=Actinokineospora inagensis TaxID=103730 RepID=UPI001FE0B7B2|nr:hypothetical protein [Actinokineospora inagensis]